MIFFKKSCLDHRYCVRFRLEGACAGGGARGQNLEHHTSQLCTRLYNSLSFYYTPYPHPPPPPPHTHTSVNAFRQCFLQIQILKIYLLRVLLLNRELRFNVSVNMSGSGAVGLGVGLGSYQPGIYGPLKALFLDLFITEIKKHFLVFMIP